MVYFEKLLSLFSGTTEDELILLLTGILNELHAIKFPLVTSEDVTNLLLDYHKTNGGVGSEPDSNVLKQYTRSQVADYLAEKLNTPYVLKEIQDLCETSQ